MREPKPPDEEGVTWENWGGDWVRVIHWRPDPITLSVDDSSWRLNL